MVACSKMMSNTLKIILLTIFSTCRDPIKSKQIYLHLSSVQIYITLTCCLDHITLIMDSSVFLEFCNKLYQTYTILFPERMAYCSFKCHCLHLLSETKLKNALRQPKPFVKSFLCNQQLSCYLRLAWMLH